MEEVDTKLLKQIKNLTELELTEIEVLFAKFNKTLIEKYEDKISNIQKNIDDQIVSFGEDIEKYKNEKQMIIDRYINEFQKIYDKRKEQYYNIIVEIQEIQANQKIALANFYSVANKNRQNPRDDSQKKLEALVTKYDGYSEIIIECEKKLEECINASVEDFNEIVKYRDVKLDNVKKINPVIKFINNLINKIFKKSKLEKEVIEKMENEIYEIENQSKDMINIIEEQTIDLIAKIEEIRDQINLEFKVAIG